MVDTIEFGGAEGARRPLGLALRRGWKRRCPACGEGAAFAGYTRVAESCSVCGLELHHQRADDLPPYLSIFIVGHLVVPSMLMVEQQWEPAVWVHWLIWMPLVILLSLYLLPRLKGATVGLQWANRMHGFGDDPDPDEPQTP